MQFLFIYLFIYFIYLFIHLKRNAEVFKTSSPYVQKFSE